MARTNAVKREQSAQKEVAVAAIEEPVTADMENPELENDISELPADIQADSIQDNTPANSIQEPEPVADVLSSKPQVGAQDIDTCLNTLKTLLTAVEKLQKVRQEIGDVKPLLVRMLDGEVMSGEELEQLKSGVAGLLRLVRAYSDHQTALTNAQSARDLLDNVLK